MAAFQGERATAAGAVTANGLTRKDRVLVVSAALMALFLGALDTLVMGAAMPTIVADMGGLELYSWVFSVYLLSRAVALPIFGKLADLYNGKHLFGFAIAIFLAGSLVAGVSTSMVQLIVARVLQGVGAGAAFALVYILLADIAAPEKRGKMMSIASFVWGLASVLGPPMGGFIVNYWSWRWIFFINLPLGCLSFLGIYLYFKETRVKKRRAALDLLGAATLTLTVLSLLTVFLMTGNHYRWLSLPIIGLLSVSLAGGVAFYYAEKHAADPILSIDFLGRSGFSSGNAAAFLSSFAIFSLVGIQPAVHSGCPGKIAGRDGGGDDSSQPGVVGGCPALRSDGPPREETPLCSGGRPFSDGRQRPGVERRPVDLAFFDGPGIGRGRHGVRLDCLPVDRTGQSEDRKPGCCHRFAAVCQNARRDHRGGDFRQPAQCPVHGEVV